MTIYKDFDLNDYKTEKPWGPRESQAWKDAIDTLVMDCIVQTKQTGGHKHAKMYSPSAVVGLEVLGGGVVQIAGLDSAGIVLNDASGNLSTADKLPVAKGGTNSSAALTNDLVMVSVEGVIIESAITIDELSLLDDMTGLATGTSNNDKFATQGYVDDNVFPAIVPIDRGGTNSDTALNDDRVMISESGKIVESAQVTITELNLLNGLVSIETGTSDNDKLVTKGYVDDIGLVSILPIASGGTNSDTALGDDLVMISESGKIVEGVVTVTELGLLDGLTGTDLTNWGDAYTHSQIAGGDSVHVSGTENTNWDTAYTHSQIAGGDSVHVSGTENTQWDTAYTHSQVAGGDSVHVSVTENTNWDTAYSHSQSAHAPPGAEVNVNADWNSSSGDSEILNKPTLVTAFLGLSDTPGSYSGEGGKLIAVNSTPDGVEFITNDLHTHSNKTELDGISSGDISNWDAGYTHSQIAGGDSVHVSGTENTNWDTAYTHSQVTTGNPHSISFSDLDGNPSDVITAGTNLTWDGDTLNASGGGVSTFLALTDTIGSFNTGRILFESGAAVTDSADLTWASSILYVNGDVGVGTTAPLLNVGTAAGDFTGHGVHIKSNVGSSEPAFLILEGASDSYKASGIIFSDNEGSADAKLFGIYMSSPWPNGGSFQLVEFALLDDDADFSTARKTMNMSPGGVGINPGQLAMNFVMNSMDDLAAFLISASANSGNGSMTTKMDTLYPGESVIRNAGDCPVYIDSTSGEFYSVQPS